MVITPPPSSLPESVCIAQSNLAVREDSKHGVFVDGMTRVVVTSPFDLLFLLQEAFKVCSLVVAWLVIARLCVYVCVCVCACAWRMPFGFELASLSLASCLLGPTFAHLLAIDFVCGGRTEPFRGLT